MFADEIVSRAIRFARHLAGHLRLVRLHERQRLRIAHRADEGDRHLRRDVERVDVNLLSALEPDGVGDEEFGEFVETGIVHGEVEC